MGPEGGLMQAPSNPSYVQKTASVPGNWLIALITLRTGGHHLAIETGRWSSSSKANRVCLQCEQGTVEDEMHLLFGCPAYNGVCIRLRFSESLFSLLGGVQAITVAVLQEGQGWRFMEQEPSHFARFCLNAWHCKTNKTSYMGMVVSCCPVTLMLIESEDNGVGR